MKIIWIDPSSSNIWLCIINENDPKPILLTSFKWKSTLTKDPRIIKMIQELEVIIKDYLDESTIVFVEYPVVFRNAKWSLVVAESLGYIKKMLYDIWVNTIHELNVMHIKSIVWKSKKEHLVALVNNVFESKQRKLPKNDHECDAYLIALAGLKRYYNSKIADDIFTHKPRVKKPINNLFTK